MEFVKYHKEIYDSIHGYIKLSKLACLIVDTPQFQRLRYLHQLGTCHYIFPCASHTRFEHSIGTYYLTGKVLETLKLNSDNSLINSYLLKIPELKLYYQDKDKLGCLLDPYICELVKIAALCHDIGHGPFSHVFDDIFLSSVSKGHELELHEARSCAIIKYIIKNNEILLDAITEQQIQFIINLINPLKTMKGFIYQIVSNSFNSIDVDKFDYIARDTALLGLKYSIDVHRLIDDMIVIDNKICFPEKIYYEIISLFKTRYRLHKQIYCHKSVMSIQFMFNDIMLLLDDMIGIYDSILDIDKFTDLTEDYIVSYLKILYKNKNNYEAPIKDKIEKAYNIWQRINKRDLYKLVGTFVSKSDLDLNYIMSNVDKDKCLGNKTKIGTVSGSKHNPMDKTYFYKKSNLNVCMKVSNEHVSFLESKIYQEYIYMFFTKDDTSDGSVEKFKEFINKLNE